MKLLNNIEGLPSPRGPFSSGVVAEGKFLFVAGQGPWDPTTERFECRSVAEQTELTLECIRRILAAAGGGPADVVSCRVFLADLNEATFQEMNGVFATFFGDHRPARTTVGSQLLGIDVEIDCIARLP